MTSSHPWGAHGPVACAMSPTTVMEPESERRASMRSCIGERSCTSSTTMWPKERISSSEPLAGPVTGTGDVASPWGQNATSCDEASSLLCARARLVLPARRGPSRVRASSISAVSATVQCTVSSEALRGRYSRCTSAGLRTPLPAAVSRARAPKRSWRNSCGERRGHIRSSASATSGTRRNRCARSACSSWVGASFTMSVPPRLSRDRYSSERARSTCASTKRRHTLWVPGRRRATGHDVLGRPGAEA